MGGPVPKGSESVVFANKTTNVGAANLTKKVVSKGGVGGTANIPISKGIQKNLLIKKHEIKSKSIRKLEIKKLALQIFLKINIMHINF